MTDSNYRMYLNAVQNWAGRFHRELFPAGGPYDPFLLADHLGVEVNEVDLNGVDGYVESNGSKYRIFISARSNCKRQRFTLSHEIAHVIFMRAARKGGIKDSYLIRYRRNGLPRSDFQDEREERLCNAFAQEFLLPTDALVERGFSSDISPRDILRISDEFQVSMQSVAVKLAKLFNPVRIVCSLWNLKTPWPVPAWWTGGETWFRKKWLTKSDLATMEQLATISTSERREITEIWGARGRRTFAIRIRIAPTYSKTYALAALCPFKPLRRISEPQSCPSDLSGRKRYTEFA